MRSLIAAALLSLALLSSSQLRAQAPGAIVAVGGGGTTPAIVARTLELAGGTTAIVAVLPQASELPTAGDGSVKRCRGGGPASSDARGVHRRPGRGRDRPAPVGAA